MFLQMDICCVLFETRSNDRQREKEGSSLSIQRRRSLMQRGIKKRVERRTCLSKYRYTYACAT